MDKLTARQQQVLDLIRSALEEHGMPPTRAEIARELGFRSQNAAETHIKALERKGMIELVAGASRGIRLLGEVVKNPGLPLVGRVAAGEPILAEEHIESHYVCDPAIFHPAPDYLLRVHGESMRDVGILDGDLLAVHRTPDASNGQIVVARVGEEVTVKRFEKSKNRIRLLPENPDFKPIEINPALDELNIEGLAVGVIRNRIN